MKVKLKDGEVVYHKGNVHIRNGEIIDIPAEDYELNKEYLDKVEEAIVKPKKKKTFGDVDD